MTVAVQPEADASDLPFIVAFDVLQIVGFLLLVPVVLTAWRSPRVQRTSTWFAFVLSWVLSSVAFVIIVGQQTGPAPMAGVCLFQAALIYATPALYVCAVESCRLVLKDDGPRNAFTAVAYLFQVSLAPWHTTDWKIGLIGMSRSIFQSMLLSDKEGS